MCLFFKQSELWGQNKVVGIVKNVKHAAEHSAAEHEE